MPRKKQNKSYYEQLRQRLYDNRLIAWTMLVAGIGLAGLKYYSELSAVVSQIWKETGTVEFVTEHTPLIEHGSIEIERDSRAVQVAGFNAPVAVELGAYKAAAYIDSRVLMRLPFMAQPDATQVVFRARFAVKGIVVNGNGRPLSSVVVRIDGRSARTKDDGLFVVEDLPMRRTYDIEAFPESGGVFSSQHPWTGTVYNGDWATTITQNIALVW